jgi:hypothetical protein
MIINRQILELMGTCEESLAHFTQVLGGGNDSFQMSFDDAVRYLRALESSDPETYRGWADFVDGFSKTPAYLKAAAQYTYGGYVLIGDGSAIYETVEDAKTARTAAQAAKFEQEKQAFSGQLYVAAVRNDGGFETLSRTDVEVDGCSYMVFNPLSGEHERLEAFAEAQARLAEIERLVLEPRCVVRLGRRIMINGEVAAIDVVEDA